MASVYSTNAPSVWLHKPSKQYVVKRKGRMFYLGKNQLEAQQLYEKYRKLIDQGLPLPSSPHSYTVADACSTFIEKYCDPRIESGQMRPRTRDDYFKTGERIIEFFGGETPLESLGPMNFTDYKIDISNRWNVVSVGNEITRIKTIFNYSVKQEIVDFKINYGVDFVRPEKREVRRYNNSKDEVLFTAKEINLLIDELGVHMRAMVYLGINCAFKNEDCGILPLEKVDFENALIQWPRPKTQEIRCCTLWPETVEALKASLARRPEPKDEFKDLFFVTVNGLAWTDGGRSKNPIGDRTRAALKRAGIYRPGVAFSALRTTFRTIADNIDERDERAANLIMGHVDDSMASVYIQKVWLNRLTKITETVREWMLNQ